MESTLVATTASYNMPTHLRNIRQAINLYYQGRTSDDKYCRQLKEYADTCNRVIREMYKELETIQGELLVVEKALAYGRELELSKRNERDHITHHGGGTK